MCSDMEFAEWMKIKYVSILGLQPRDLPAMLLVNTMKMELSSQRIEMLLFFTTNMAARRHVQTSNICKYRSEIDKQYFRDDSVPKRRNFVEDLLS